MTQALSDDSKAALLLCGHFFKQRDEAGAKPLAPREFNDVSKWLGRSSLGPAALFDDTVRSAFSRETGISEPRLRSLINRGGALALAVERWASRGIWVLTRLDADYPGRLNEKLRGSAPVILFGAGPTELLNRGGLAVVGSRDADEDAISFARLAGEKCAGEGIQVISGAARGIDEQAMLASLDQGGGAAGVASHGLEQLVMSRKYRDAILDGRATLISPFHPDAGFNAGNAMSRNPTIYALADAALVVSSDLEEGGTWAGARDDLKHGYVRLFVRNVDRPGNLGLLRAGAERWPENFESIRSVVAAAPLSASPDMVTDVDSSVDVFDVVAPHILRALQGGKTDKELAEALHLELTQMRAWLKRLVADGRVTRMKKPVRYVAARATAELKLF
jgi:predicted Rossmann fold nucleotide-binding protein DprA/Smf involved in DNA uptake